MSFTSSPDSDEPRGIAAHVTRQTALPPPVPKGRGVVLGLLAAAVIIAVIVQFTTSYGPAAGLRKRVEEQKRARPTAAPEPSERPDGPARRAELVTDEGAEDAPLPVEAPGANLAVPDGLSDRAAGRLRLSLAGLREARIIAVSAVKDLAAMVQEASDEDRAILRPFVVERLATTAGNPRLGAWALDAGLVLATDDPTGLGPLVAAALNPGLREDATTPAAILLLDTLGEEEREASVAALDRLLRHDARPVHLRVLAARTLAGWGVAPKAEPKFPAPVRTALEGD